MSSLLSVILENVSKSYTLYGSQRDQLLSIMNLTKLGFKLSEPKKEFIALKDISLQIPKGQKVGIIGRNGSGKTTLLKLIGQNFSPTSGHVKVSGKIQSLMTSGIGFHDESTGRENIHTSLSFNDLPSDKYDQAVDEIIEFCELGEFIDQPFKTYSLGMQSRLQFACVTAVNPDILIVDEVLGAGDVYFSVKSSIRMSRLVKSGANLILVSHSMQQILQYCERVIWIDGGAIIEDGKALDVVKNYEKFMFELSLKIENTEIIIPEEEVAEETIPEEEVAEETIPEEEVAEETIPEEEVAEETIPDKPMPSWFSAKLGAELQGSTVKDVDTSSDLSIWKNYPGLSIYKFKMLGPEGKDTRIFESKEKFVLEITINAEEPGKYNCWYVYLIYGQDGQSLVRNVSDKKTYNLTKNEKKTIRLEYKELMLVEGEYHVSIGIFKKWTPQDRSSRNWYEILSRSVHFKVQGNIDNNPGKFLHPCTWQEL
jgi:lipopolysaccharide transport system ATP-binding protein